MKKAIEWFNLLPEPARSRAIENTINFRKDNLEIEYKSMENAIACSFRLQHCPELFGYWNNVVKNFRSGNNMRKVEEDSLDSKILSPTCPRCGAKNQSTYIGERKDTTIWRCKCKHEYSVKETNETQQTTKKEATVVNKPVEKKETAITKLDTKKMQPVFDKSLEIINDVLDGSSVDENILRVALSAVVSYTKIKAADIAAANLFYSIAKDVSDDKQQLKQIMSDVTNVDFSSKGE